ncbi:ATP-binding protein [Streptomyces sp. NPDC089733]|uniref:ATP-binding protein n=1 Tax=Streptomyces sp. NPDC089733 TaxID=3365918 RepID=UPI003803235B
MAPGSALIPRHMDLSPGTEALRYCFALPAHPESVAGARRLTRARLDEWRLDADAHDSAILIVSELVTDAVGVPARYGFRLMSHLPRTGCVFADADRWWWIVPSGSDLDLDWPPQAAYAKGAFVPAVRPRLIHRPDGHTPYTPPIPLFLMVCQVTGVAPSWAPSGGERAVSAP